MNKYYRKIFIKFAVLFFFILASAGNLWARELSLLGVNEGNWQVIADSGQAGATSGKVDKTKNGRELVYELKATQDWPWPEIDFLVTFPGSSDLSGFSGVLLDILGQPGKEMYFYFLVEDRNLARLKPVVSRFMFTGKRQKIYLPLLGFKIASDWQPRNTGYADSFELDKTRSFGLHLKGRNNQKGKVTLFDLKLLQNKPTGSDCALIRSFAPKFYKIKIKQGVLENAQTEIIIESAKNQQAVPPYLFGANWGVWLNLPSKKKVAGLQPRILRAGGPFIDRSNWRNSKFTFPGSNLVIPMTSLDQFIAYCRNIGAEPLIQINALGFIPTDNGLAKLNQSEIAQQAKELLIYLNKEKKYNVKFFEIGNEPFIWHKVHSDVRQVPCSAGECFSLFKNISLALKKAQNEINPDLKIKVFAPSFCLEDMQFAEIAEFLRRCRSFQDNRKENPLRIRILDVLNFHYFPSFSENLTGNLKDDINRVLGSVASFWDGSYKNKIDSHLPFGFSPEILPRFKKLIKDNYEGTELALTEFNIEAESMVEYDPLIKALYFAKLYGVLARGNLDYFMQFVLNSSDQHAALLDDLDNLTALYYPFELYSRHFRGYLLDVKNTLTDKLDIYACDNNGDIIIMVINKQNQPCLAEITAKSGKAGFFTHSFPALSLSCIKIKDKSSLAECWEYGQGQIRSIKAK